MSTTGDNIRALTNQFIRTYPVEAFQGMALNRILLMFADWIDSGGTTGPVTTPALTIVTSANFTTARDCPIPALAGKSIAVFWCDPPKPLFQTIDWTPFPGGGFTMNDLTFDASTGNFTFWVYITT